ncbi:vitamin B12-dependent methionine synthase family protein [Butyrivibrio sp. CAG:318]|nr:vitamin B12-dependent methionine synthase family protein [Butyrivibrio sp. CAG:318]
MDIREELGRRIIFFDGGLGSLLQERGLKPGELPETWNLTRPEVLYDIHRAYLDAGADIILANTFGANGFKYDNLEEIVTAAVVNAKKAVADSGRKAYVALDMGPTGKLLKPMGTLDFEECVSIYADVVRYGAKAGADLILIETMSDTYELKAAVLAAKENSNLPVVATVVFDEHHKMLTGATPEVVVALLEGLRVDAIGMNCGLGPKQMKPIFETMARYASIPLVITPNAGLPRSENGKTVYDVGPEEFAEDMEEIINMGAWMAGGCCGTTPAHIKALTERCFGITPKPLTDKDYTIVTSYSTAVELGGRPVIIGERINPTGKSKFKQALRDNNMEYILEEGVKQADSGAHILDVNVGLPEIDEPAMMRRTVYELQSVLPLPLQIDTTDPVAMEQAMRIYNGKPMINSVNGKEEIMHQIFPLVQKYGGTVVGLALDEAGIPDTAEGRLAVAKKIYDTAAQYGIKPKDIVIDALTMTMSTDNNSANITLDTVREIKAHGGRTVLGVSNISFGLPQREVINSGFFLMAMQAGLSAGIINPNARAMIQAYDTYCVLGGFDSQCMSYIEKYAVAEPTPVAQTVTSVKQAGKAVTGNLSLTDCIVKGLKEQAYKATKDELGTKDTMEIINGELVPALDIVGKGFEKGTVFLPQLLMSAEAAKAGFEAIKEYVSSQGTNQEKKATIVIATVKGDIHDIGKNIVKVLLENYGYDVIDLGKDVPPETVVDKVIETHAPLVGLSALMTTTVVSMEETIKKLHESAPWCKIMVGGAVLTQEYADMIGADFYGKDAMQSVYYAEELLNPAK